MGSWPLQMPGVEVHEVVVHIYSDQFKRVRWEQREAEQRATGIQVRSGTLHRLPLRENSPWAVLEYGILALTVVLPGANAIAAMTIVWTAEQ